MSNAVTEAMELKAQAYQEAMANTDGADVRTVLLAVLGCASSWVGEARIIGNVRADDIVRAISAAISAHPSPVGDPLSRRVLTANDDGRTDDGF